MGKKKIWIGVLSFAVALVVVTWSVSKRKSPALTPLALAQARTRWQGAGIRGYDIEIQVKGREPQHVVGEIRDGKVTSLKVNGEAAPPRTWESWSVDGLFRILEEELSNAASPQGAFGVSDPSEVYLDASFDAGTGVPRRYLRQVQGRDLTIDWEVVKFAAR